MPLLAWAGLLACARAAGLGDLGGLVQLQLQVHAGGEEEAAPAELCVVQDGRCFDQRLEVRAPASEPLPAGFAEIVVTRAGEDVRWLDALPEVPAVVYDRGGAPSLLPRPRGNLRILPQANTGREDDEMLRHILDHYEELPNVTVFLQGWPLLHCAGVVETLRKVLRSMRAPGGAEALGNGAAEGLVPLSRTFYEYSEPEGLLGYARAMAEAHEAGGDVMEKAVSMYAKTCRKILGRPCPERHWVAEGAQWAVSRERIRSQPPELYRRALELGEGYQGKLRGLVLEAVWPVLWGEDAWAPSADLVAEGASEQADQALEAGATFPGFLSLLGKGVRHGREPSEDWCRRWHWSWLCERAGLPAQEGGGQRRRRRLAANAYGGFSRRSLQAAGGHCAPESGGEGLRWSCEDRMAYCALQGPQVQASRQLELQLPRFHARGREQGGHLEMLVRVCALLLPGARHCLRAGDAGAGLWMQPQGPDSVEGTQWYLLGLPGGNGTEESLGSRTFLLSATSPRHSTRYLGCGGAGGEALLSASPAPWLLVPALDGLMRLRAAVGGRYLQLGAGPSYGLLCGEGGQGDSSVFSLHLEAHAPPEAAQELAAKLRDGGR